MPDTRPVLLFDGNCNLCSGAVRFLHLHQKTDRFRFIALQSEHGISLLEKHHLPADHASSLVLLDRGKVYVKSDAALRSSRHLSGFWQIGMLLLAVPHWVRDPVYQWIAAHRHRWPGQVHACPSPEEE